MTNGAQAELAMMTGDAQESLPRLDNMLKECIAQVARTEMIPSPHVMNNVLEEVCIYNNPPAVHKVLLHVLRSVLRFSPQQLIRISAKTYSDVVLIHLRDTNILDEDKVRPALLDMQPWVEELGGFLDITSQRPSETTIAFSFPNIPE